MYGGYSLRWPPEAHPSIIPFFWMQAEFVASSQLIKTNRKVAKMMGYHSPDSVQFSHSIRSDSLRPHGLQHTRLPSPFPTPRACLNSYPWSQWCHPTVSCSVIPIFSCLQSFPASGSFPRSQFSASGGQSVRVSASASVLPMNIQDWFSLPLTSWISLQCKGLSRVFSNTIIQKYQFFGTGLSL